MATKSLYKRVLLMGGTPTVRDLLRRAVRRSRTLQLTTATDGAALVGALADGTFDYALLDLSPSPNGVWDDFLYLRQMLPEVPVVGLLETSNPAIELRAQSEGLWTFIHAPFRVRALQKAFADAQHDLTDLSAYRRSISHLEAAHRIHASLKLEETVRHAARELFRLTPCHRIRILLADLESDRPAFGFEATFSESGRVLLQEIDRDEASLELAADMLQGQSAYAENILLLPLRCGDEPVGLLNLKHPRTFRLKDHEISMLEYLAGHVASAVRNAQRQTALKRRHDQIFLLNEVGRQVSRCLEFDTILTDIVDHVRRYFGYDIVAIYLPSLVGPQGQNHYLAGNIGGNAVVRASILDGDLGLIHYVMNTQQTVVCHDLSRQTNWRGHHSASRSKLVCPIWIDGQIGGTLEFESTRPHAFDASDRRVAEDISMQIAVAVRNTQLYHQAQAAREYLQAVLDVAVDTAIVSTDMSGHIITFSKGAEVMFGYASDEMEGNSVLPLYEGSRAQTIIQELFHAQSLEPWESDVQLYRRDGESFFAFLTVRPLRSLHSPGWLFLLLDITQRLNLQERLHRLSITDELTGLYNKRYFHVLLPRETSRTERQRAPLVLCYFDLDGFKGYNDRCGHVRGDELLKWVGTLVQQVIRRNVDMPFRYGGDEFVLLLPGTRAQDGAQVGERIRKAVESQYGGEVTVSFGIAEYRGEPPEEFTSRADQVMYAAKRAGGNRVLIDE